GERPVRAPVRATRAPLEARLASPRAMAVSTNCGVERLRWTFGPSVRRCMPPVMVAAPMRFAPSMQNRVLSHSGGRDGKGDWGLQSWLRGASIPKCRSFDCVRCADFARDD